MKLVEFKRVADILAQQHRIKLRPGNGWAANLKTNELFYREEDVLNLEEDHVLGMLLHEIAHIRYTTHTDLPEKNKEILHSTMNMLEDLAIENLIGQDYPNAGRILNSTKEDVLDGLLRILPKLETSKQEKALLFASARFEGRGSNFNFLDYEKTGNKVAILMKSREDDILNRHKTSNLLPTALEIVDIILNELGDLTEEEKQKLQREHQDQQNPQAQTEDGEVKKQIKKYLKDQKGNNWYKGLDNYTSQASQVEEIVEQANNMGKRLRSVLKRNQAMEFGGNFRTGKLKTKSLRKIRTSKTPRPFSRRIIKSNQSYEFAIATDVSGSMNNNYGNFTALSAAMSSMYMVGEALRMAKVPRTMHVFGDKAVQMTTDKKNKILWEEISDYNRTHAAGGGTQIDAAIKHCSRVLQNSKAERKIMIIVTDGGSDEDSLRYETEKAKKLGIECIGITIKNHPDEYGALAPVFGPDNNKDILYSNIVEISDAFINILKKTVKRAN